MRLRKIGIDFERRQVMSLRGGVIAVLAQNIGEIDAPDRVPRMALHRLAIGGARCGAVAAGVGQRSQIVQRVETSGIEAQRFEVGLLRRLVVAAHGETAGVFHSRFYRAIIRQCGCPKR